MEEITIPLRGEYIKLGQALKAAGVASSGVEAKYIIQDQEVSVNGKIERQRGKKLHAGDIIVYEDTVIRIMA